MRAWDNVHMNAPKEGLMTAVAARATAAPAQVGPVQRLCCVRNVRSESGSELYTEKHFCATRGPNERSTRGTRGLPRAASGSGRGWSPCNRAPARHFCRPLNFHFSGATVPPHLENPDLLAAQRAERGQREGDAIEPGRRLVTRHQLEDECVVWHGARGAGVEAEAASQPDVRVDERIERANDDVRDAVAVDELAGDVGRRGRVDLGGGSQARDILPVEGAKAPHAAEVGEPGGGGGAAQDGAGLVAQTRAEEVRDVARQQLGRLGRGRVAEAPGEQRREERKRQEDESEAERGDEPTGARPVDG